MTQQKRPVAPMSMRYKAREKVTLEECKGMYELFSQYYHNTPFDTFLSDLAKKKGVFIAKRHTDQKVVGFSTATTFDVDVDGRPVRLLFSGDTVMHKDYWGHPAFRKAFFMWLVRERLKNPLIEMHWFLISMGYRTYLILANNFYDYYPNIDGDDPHLKNVAMAASDYLFPNALNRDTMLLEFGDEACKLQEFVTPISASERQVPKIAFFESRNPNWMHGSEMPCVGSLDHKSILKVFGDARKTLLNKGKRRLNQQASSNPNATGTPILEPSALKQVGQRLKKTLVA